MFYIVSILACLNGAYAAYTCHGDIMALHPGGQAGTGVSGSRHDVDLDYSYLQNKRSCYEASGARHCIQPAVIAAIADRETRGGKLIAHTGGWGDGHHGYGIMQCDIRYHQCTSHAWDSCGHIEQMVSEVLVPYIRQVAAKHPSWPKEVQLKGGIAAYNSGVHNIQTISGMDIGTTHNDYSNDVSARAQWLISHYHWS